MSTLKLLKDRNCVQTIEDLTKWARCFFLSCQQNRCRTHLLTVNSVAMWHVLAYYFEGVF
jgi:hypothetical protein